jgi:succinate dehydrogenase / fumarate reductase, iron-sulfur subunit
VRLSIYRYNPDVDARPQMRDYTVELQPGDQMLLDVLERIRAEQDDSLAYRRSCREGICGSDGMNINGKNGLACITSVHELNEPVVIRPLPSLPVVRDLVVDMTLFFQQYYAAKPYLINEEPRPARERPQSPADRDKLNGLYECILCACCSTQCPSWWWNPDKFLGPAALLWAARFITDSRDRGVGERLDELEDPYKLFRCRTILNCAEVCPKGLNPGKAIGHIRELLVERIT